MSSRWTRRSPGTTTEDARWVVRSKPTPAATRSWRRSASAQYRKVLPNWKSAWPMKYVLRLAPPAGDHFRGVRTFSPDFSMAGVEGSCGRAAVWWAGGGGGVRRGWGGWGGGGGGGGRWARE